MFEAVTVLLTEHQLPLKADITQHPHIVVAAYQDPTLAQQRAVLDARAKFATGQ